MKLLRLALLATLLFSFSNAGAATLSESPANIAQGGPVTATWTTIANPTNRDWIGLYASGAADAAYLDWFYVSSCNKSGGASVLANGSCPFVIPSSLPNGSFELRIFSNNGYTRLATSGQFNVTNTPPRYVDNGDGTITDNQTGLMWEKKTGSVSTATFNFCVTPSDCLDASNVNNLYAWSVTGTAPDGPLFTNFLEVLNGQLCSVSTCQGLGNHTDWRLPTIAEVKTILATCPGQNLACIDLSFGPTQRDFYWTSTTFVDIPINAWILSSNETVSVNNKVTGGDYARAVRGGR